MLSFCAPIPPSLDFVSAAALPAAAGTAMRTLNQLGVSRSGMLLIGGASGSAAVQFAVARGAHVIRTSSPANQNFGAPSAPTRSLLRGPRDRVRALAPDGADFALDVAGRAKQRRAGPQAKHPRYIE